jgi:hypothetical protein
MVTLSSANADQNGGSTTVFKPGLHFRRNLHFRILVTERSKRMDQDNRVLGRKGARELSEQEVESVTGALKVLHTLSPCFVDRKQQFFNGDQTIGECGG